MDMSYQGLAACWGNLLAERREEARAGFHDSLPLQPWVALAAANFHQKLSHSVTCHIMMRLAYGIAWSLFLQTPGHSGIHSEKMKNPTSMVDFYRQILKVNDSMAIIIKFLTSERFNVSAFQSSKLILQLSLKRDSKESIIMLGRSATLDTLESMGKGEEAEQRRSTEAFYRENSKTIRASKRAGMPILSLSATAFGMVGSCILDMTLPLTCCCVLWPPCCPCPLSLVVVSVVSWSVYTTLLQLVACVFSFSFQFRGIQYTS